MMDARQLKNRVGPIAVWAEDRRIMHRTYNATSKTLASKPGYRSYTSGDDLAIRQILVPENDP